MKSYLEYINEAVTTKSSFMKLYDALKEAMPDADLSKVDKKITLIGMFGTMYLTGARGGLFKQRCGNDDNIVKTTLGLLAKLFDESQDFINDIYNGKTPRKSKYIKPSAKISKMMDKYFLWDTGVLQIPWGNFRNMTFQTIIDNLKAGKKFTEIVDMGDSEYENYIAWMTSIAYGKEVSRY